MKTRFKHPANRLRAGVLLCGLLAAAARAAVPVVWTNTPAATQPYPVKPVPHGSTVDFAVTLRGYTSPPIESGADVRLWFQTNGMGSAWWSAPATFDGSTITASFGPAQDCGADRVSLFFGAPSNVFASAVLRLTHAPGFSPSSLPLPVQRLDFAAVEIANAPYYTQAETDARIVALAPTPGDYANVSNRAMSALQPSALSSANPAFAAAVTNCPVVIAADADIAEYGTYGTVAAALAALAAGLAALKRGKIDKVTGSGIAGYFPTLKSDGGLQRSYYTPQSFASSGHSHDATSVWYDGYDVASKLDDLEARVAALEAAAGGDVGVTLGTVYHNGMAATAYPGTVGCSDYSYSTGGVDPYACMTCLMIRADSVLDPTCGGDFYMGGELRSDFYGVVAGVEYENASACTTARFALALYDGATCYGSASPLSDRSDFDYWRSGSPSSGCRGRLVQDADGTWWLCCTPRIQCFGETPSPPMTYSDDDPYEIAAAMKSAYYSSCYDVEAQMRAFLQYASCGCGEGEVVAEGDTTVTISEYPAI